VLITANSGVATSYTGMKNITVQYAIGKRSDQAFSYYYGELDELAIWKSRVLTSGEVLALYRKGRDGNAILP